MTCHAYYIKCICYMGSHKMKGTAQWYKPYYILSHPFHGDIGHITLATTILQYGLLCRACYVRFATRSETHLAFEPFMFNMPTFAWQLLSSSSSLPAGLLLCEIDPYVHTVALLTLHIPVCCDGVIIH